MALIPPLNFGPVGEIFADLFLHIQILIIQRMEFIDQRLQTN